MIEGENYLKHCYHIRTRTHRLLPVTAVFVAHPVCYQVPYTRRLVWFGVDVRSVVCVLHSCSVLMCGLSCVFFTVFCVKLTYEVWLLKKDYKGDDVRIRLLFLKSHFHLSQVSQVSKRLKPQQWSIHSMHSMHSTSSVDCEVETLLLGCLSHSSPQWRGSINFMVLQSGNMNFRFSGVCQARRRIHLLLAYLFILLFG